LGVKHSFIGMLATRKWITAVILLLACVAVNMYSNNTFIVENDFSTHFYPAFSKILRATFGWLPFSIGDFLYGGLVVFLLIKLFHFFRFFWSKKSRMRYKSNIIPVFYSIFIFCSVLYLVFNIFWGINYNRIGIATQLNLTIEKYSVEDLKKINDVLVEKINLSKYNLIQKNAKYPTSSEMFLKTENAYISAEKKYPFLHYENRSIKKSMWGWLGNYTGFLGYYNPFTGEAQVNTTVPKFTQPFTTCHEVAHQLGYAKEMEANFVGYLAASASLDTLFRYSVYTDLFTYANRTLYFVDSASSLEYRKKLLPEVIADFIERKKFNMKHKSFAEPIVSYFYNIFLESNEQPMGILSYDEVTAFIIAYYKKYRTI
jgi:Protein of unknown function (DUF3810)